MLYVSNSLRDISQKCNWFYYLFGAACIIATGSRTALAAAGLALVFSFFLNSMDVFNKRLFRTALLVLPFLLFAFAFLSSFYLFGSSFIQKIDEVLLNRIWLNWFALGNFDISVFGQQVSMHVEGVHNELRDTWNITTTVDCTYVATSISYGLFGIFMWLLSYVLAFRRAWNEHKAAVVSVLAIFALYAFMESQLTDVLINFGLFCTFSNLATRDSGRCGLYPRPAWQPLLRSRRD